MPNQYIQKNFTPDLKTVPPSYKMSCFHTHNLWELLYLISGSCTLYLNEHMYLLQKGSLALIPVNAKHMTTYLSGPDNTRSLLYFDDNELTWFEKQNISDIRNIVNNSFVVQIPARKQTYIKELIDKVSYEFRGVDNISDAFATTYFHELLLYALRCQTYNDNVVSHMDVSNETIQKVIEYIINNYMQDLTLTMLSEKFNMSESSLSKKFKAFTGHRFRKYLVDVRTHAAAELLRETNLSMTEIADRCGFSDSNTFGDTFKRVFGKSPSSYRKSL